MRPNAPLAACNADRLAAIVIAALIAILINPLGRTGLPSLSLFVHLTTLSRR